MKLKRGNPITCINDLVGCIKRSDRIFSFDMELNASCLSRYTIEQATNQIENRDFYYAVEDE